MAASYRQQRRKSQSQLSSRPACEILEKRLLLDTTFTQGVSGATTELPDMQTSKPKAIYTQTNGGSLFAAVLGDGYGYSQPWFSGKGSFTENLLGVQSVVSLSGNGITYGNGACNTINNNQDAGATTVTISNLKPAKYRVSVGIRVDAVVTDFGSAVRWSTEPMPGAQFKSLSITGSGNGIENADGKQAAKVQIPYLEDDDLYELYPRDTLGPPNIPTKSQFWHMCVQYEIVVVNEAAVNNLCRWKPTLSHRPEMYAPSWPVSTVTADIYVIGMHVVDAAPAAPAAPAALFNAVVVPEASIVSVAESPDELISSAPIAAILLENPNSLSTSLTSSSIAVSSFGTEYSVAEPIEFADDEPSLIDSVFVDCLSLIDLAGVSI